MSKRYVRQAGEGGGMTTPKTIRIGDEKYVWSKDVPALKPVTEENGRIYLDRAVLVFRWESLGFDGVLSNPKSTAITIRLEVF